MESDKASTEFPSSQTGVVQADKVKMGDKVKQSSVVLALEGAAAVPAASEAPDQPSPPAESAESAEISVPNQPVAHADSAQTATKQ